MHVGKVIIFNFIFSLTKSAKNTFIYFGIFVLEQWDRKTINLPAYIRTICKYWRAQPFIRLPLYTCICIITITCLSSSVYKHTHLHYLITNDVTSSECLTISIICHRIRLYLTADCTCSPILVLRYYYTQDTLYVLI